MAEHDVVPLAEHKVLVVEHKVRIALAGTVGNVLEWYDFGLYGLLAPILATLFFPSGNRTASLIAVYGGFASGFAMRPIGAVVLGRWGDRIGRRFVLVVSVVLMGLATIAVGLLPTYQSIGIWAPALLLLTRLFQGFSVGGEYVGSVSYLVESAAMDQRGIAGSLSNVGATLGMLAAAGVSSIVTRWSAQIPWAWRLPFFLGGVMACTAYYLRQTLPEIAPESGITPNPKVKSPLREALRGQPKTLFAALLFTSGYGIINYLAMVFLPTYGYEFAHFTEHEVLRVNTAGQALALFLVPVAGWLSDRFISRRTMLAGVCVVQALLAWSTFRLVRDGATGLWIAQLVLAALFAVIMGAAPAMLTEQFRSSYRVTAHAIVFNIGIGIVGGTAPMVAVALMHATSNLMAPAAYLAFGGAVGAIGILMLEDRSHLPIE